MKAATSSSALGFHFTKKLLINISAKASSLTLTTFDPLGSLASETSCFVFELFHTLAPEAHFRKNCRRTRRMLSSFCW
jgi:hypothetical protein